jgi:ABC-type nickel/cobalt efflux system permease component RcnA/ABC-type uncharacterized transport system substrate-binding protein
VAVTVRGTRYLIAGAACLVSALACAPPAAAHPHIFIDAAVKLVFNDAGAIARLEHAWTFDPSFSAWTTQGLDTDGDGTVSSGELQALADENMVGLESYRFYTYAANGGRDIAFEPVGDQTMVHENEQVTLRYSLTPAEPLVLDGTLELAVNDPEYYVAITVADAGAVTLENAPEGCGVEVRAPQPMSAEVEERLYALGPEVLELPPDLAAAMRGTQGLVLVTCPGGAPAATALEAVTQVAEARPAPFGGPPPEPGLTLPRTGFFGWLQAQQRDFYAGLTGALGALRTDFNAFWVLGGLSFLYGVFHAAGPGHGKVVISSYVLANERQARRGIALSFLSAMLQAVVAVAFVLIAAGVMGMTSMAMGDASYWIGVVSYALVAGLGLWLVARKVFGWGHQHGDLRAKAHGHLHEHHHHHEHHHDDHGHHHVVTPDAVDRSWREQLGVVLAVGLRPCSGALVVLVFALSQGVLMAGIAATFLMALGTGITVAVLAALAVNAKGLAVAVGGADTAVGGAVVWWVELAGALLVLGFGVMLLLASV